MNKRIIALILISLAFTAFAEISCGFIIDLSPPFVLPGGLYPPPETTLVDTDVLIEADIDDGIAGVWDDSVRIVVSVNGIPTDSTIGTTDIFQSFSSGDTVEVCLRAIDEIYDTLFCTCPANVLDTCWTFYILECDSFMVERLCPNPCGIFTSCGDQTVSMRLYPVGAPAELGIFEIEDIMAVIERSSAPAETLYAAPRLSIDGDTVIIQPPFSGYENGDTVRISLHARNDCPFIMTDTCEFIVDTEPPVATGFYPPADTTIGLSAPFINVGIFDSIAGVVPESTIVRSIARHADGTADTIIWMGPSPMVGDYLPLDTVQICILQAMDAVDYYEDCTCPPNVMDTICWEFSVFYCLAGPFAEVVYPDSCGPYVTSCADQSVSWTILDTTGLEIDDATILIHVSVRGPSGALDTTVTPTSPALNWDGVSTLNFQPGSDGWFWNSGDTVTISLVSASNTGGCPLEFSVDCSFIVDLDPPVAYDFEPAEGEVITTTAPFINAAYIDSICAVYSATSEWSIYRGGALVDGPYPFALGSSIPMAGAESGDSVVVCLDLTDYPDFDYCPPNDTTICWWFTLSLDSPVAWIIEPLDLDGDSVITSACNCQPIIIGISDGDGIDEGTIQLEVQGIVYGITNPELDWDGDSILTYTPSAPCWTDGEVIDFELTAVEDSLGTPLDAPLAGSFIADYSPPIMIASHPPDGAVIPGPWGEIAYAIFEDIPSGVDSLFPSAVFVYDDGTEIISGTALWRGDTAFVPGTEVLAVDGNIEICFENIQDSPDYCVNVYDTCFSFTVVTGEPLAEWVFPIDENGDGDTVIACDCIEIIFEITTTYGLYPESTLVRINSVDYPYDPAWMTFTDDHDSLILDPLPDCPFADGELIEVELVMLVDSTLGHLVSPVTGHFIIDRAGPEFSGAYPVSDVTGMVTDVYISASDAICGDAVADSIVVFDGGGTVFDFAYDTLGISLTGLTGGTYTVCTYAHDDCADYCGPNYSDTCWSFEVILGEPAASWIEPIDLNFDGDTISACSCQTVIFEITTSFGLYPESTVVSVGGVPYTWDPAWMTLSTDHSLLTLDPLPICPHVHGEIITAGVIALMDSTGGTLDDPETGRFRVDLRGPVFSGAYPTGTFSSPDVTIRVNASDDICSRIIADSIAVFIDGVHSVTALDTLRIPYSGLSDGEIVTVCAYAHDDCADYCGPNYSDTCWSFEIALGAINASIHYPEDIDGDGQVVTGCQCPPVQWLVYSEYDIIPESTIVSIEGVHYDWSLGILAADMGFDTLTWNFDSSNCYMDGQMLNHQLIQLFDVTGESLSLVVSDSFLIDLSPPTLLSYWPHPYTYILDPVFGFHIIDSIYRVDRTDYLITFEIPSRTDSFDYASPYSSWTGDSLIIDYTSFPESYNWGDTIIVCIYIHDVVDVCDPNYLDSCWTVVVQDTVAPYVDSWIWSSGCDDQPVPWLVYDDMVGLDTSRFEITIDGAGWALTDPEVFYSEPETLFYQPSSPWTEGVHTGCIVGMWDWMENPIDTPYCYDFLIDLTPPVIDFIEPLCSTEIHDTLAPITITVWDSLSPLNPDSLWLVVRGDTLFFGDLTWSGDTIIFDPADIGWVWAEGETVSYCLHASDMPTYCSNTDEQCCEFYVVQSSLTAMLLHPPNVFTSCSTQAVTWLFDGILDYSSPVVILDDTASFGTSDAELFIIADTLFFEPTEPWADGQFVHLCLVDASDTFGVALNDTICADFFLDFSPPLFLDFDPTPDDEVAETSPIISLIVQDILSGVDPFSIVMTIDGVEVEPTYSGDTLSFNTADSGWVWIGGDTIQVCVWASDNANFCGQNSDSICYEFSIAVGGPEIIAVIPPMDSMWSACDNQGAAFTILDPDGVDDATIEVTVNGASTASWAFASDTLFYTPSALWNHGDVVEVCVWAEDNLGNPCDDWVCRTYMIDLEPPEVVDITPLPGISISATPTFDIELIDDASGIDPSSITVSLNGNTYTPGDGYLTWDGSTIYLDPEITFAQGDTLTLCLDSIADMPDLCEPNVLDSCWIYLVEVLPDMRTDDSLVSVTPSEIFEGDTVTFTGTMFQDYTGADFNWDIVANGITILDSFAILAGGESITVLRDFTDELISLGPGNYVLCLRLDPDDHIIEWDETNNTGCTQLSIISAECDAHPSPFSPNGDGVNDYAIFNYPGQAALDAVIKVYDMKGMLVRELTNTNSWDGNDGTGKPLPKDVYMYLVLRDGDLVCKGTVYLAR